MNSQRLTRIGLFLAAVIACLGLITLVSNPEPSAPRFAIAAATEVEPADPKPEGPAPSPPAEMAGPAPKVKMRAKPGAMTEEEQRTVAEMWTTLCLSDASERLNSWNALLAEMTPANAAAVRGLFLKMDKQGRWFIPEWDAFWPRWGEVDAIGALDGLIATIGDKGYRPMVAQKIFTGWGKTDPDGARAWLDANRGRSELFGGALKGYLGGLARSDLERATQDAIALGSGSSMSTAMEVLAEQAVQQRQIGGMLEWWQSLPADASSGSARRDAVTHVYGRLKRGDDDRTADWLIDLSDTPYWTESAFNDFAERIARKNPNAALQWAVSLSPSPETGRQAGLGNAISACAKVDGAGMENWLMQEPQSPLRDQAVVAYAQYLASRQDGSAAERWLAQVQDKRWAEGNGGIGGKGTALSERLDGGTVAPTSR